MSPIVTLQFRGHGLEFAAEKHVEKRSLHNVISVMTECDLGGTNLFGKSV